MIETVVFGGGCFWCTEAIFKSLIGVKNVLSGYSGGDGSTPTYETVSEGIGEYAEVVKIEYDSSLIPFADLFEIFMHTHNPTTLNRQGADVGVQYRSVVLYTTEAQREICEKIIGKYNEDSEFGGKVVTQVEKFEQFYEAEQYHIDYYTKNKTGSYCSAVITPKLTSLRKKYEKFVKE